VVRLVTTGLGNVNETCSTHTVNKNIAIIAVALCTFLQYGGGAGHVDQKLPVRVIEINVVDTVHS
jgi:hypothetical protein